MSLQNLKTTTTLSTDAGGEPETINPGPEPLGLNPLGLNPWACHSVDTFSLVSCWFWPHGRSHDKVKG